MISLFDRKRERDHGTTEAQELMVKSLELADKFDKAFQAGQIRFDFNGHHRKRRSKPTKPKEYTYDFRRDFGYEETIIDDIHTAAFIYAKDMESVELGMKLIDNPGNGRKWVLLDGVNDLGYCVDCGKRLRYRFNGRTIKVVDACEHPTGTPITFEIDVPSGVMLFANYFDKIVDFDTNTAYRADAHGAAEHKMELEHYAAQNVAQVFCGNSCPGIYKCENRDKFWIGNAGYDSEGDNETEQMPGKSVGSICTDLWAWSMTCQDTYDKLGCEHGSDFDVKVKPGKYRVTQHWYHKGGYGPGDKADIFAEIDPVN
jgi:hypothetical protein